MLVVAHFSDTHIDGNGHSAERLARVMAYVNDLAQPIDAVVATGDVADHGSEGEYEVARSLLISPRPILTCPGNHDVRAVYRKVLLGEGAGDEPLNQLHRAAGAVFAMCDSTIPGQDDGLLADETIDWLDAALADTPDDVPVFVCFHHPPVTLRSPFVDDIRQHGEQRLAEVVSAHPQIVALLCGHAHTPAATTFADRPLLVAPGVASTVRLPWERGDVLDYRAAPAVAFHVLEEDGRVITHFRVVD